MTSFEQQYQNQGSPPWDIGKPQPAFVQAQADGIIQGDVLDAGCGTGENALFFADHGHMVLGIDGAPTAIARAQAKARERHSMATFQVVDALALEQLGRTFDTITDSGLFHTFDAADRVRYVASLARALRSGGRFVMVCFSEHASYHFGPRHRTQAEIRAAFAAGWQVASITAAQLASLIPDSNGAAWLAVIHKTP